jgi:hypothetical protein
MRLLVSDACAAPPGRVRAVVLRRLVQAAIC